MPRLFKLVPLYVFRYIKRRFIKEHRRAYTANHLVAVFEFFKQKMLAYDQRKPYRAYYIVYHTSSPVDFVYYYIIANKMSIIFQKIFKIF